MALKEDTISVGYIFYLPAGGRVGVVPYLPQWKKWVSLTRHRPWNQTSSAKLDAIILRWIAGLISFNFSISYRSDKSNIEADLLSRIQWPKEDAKQRESRKIVQMHTYKWLYHYST